MTIESAFDGTSPRVRNPCEHCIFLGQYTTSYNTFDLYYCDHCESTGIIIFSLGHGRLLSRPMNHDSVRTDHVLREGKIRAIAMKVYDERAIEAGDALERLA